MIRRHLPATIAMTAILSLVAGGLAYAAFTPEGKVSACVSSEGFVRSATYKNTCPYKTTPVLLDKSTTTGGESGPGALQLVATAKNPEPRTFVGAVNHDADPVPEGELAVVNFEVESAGLYKMSIKASGRETADTQCDSYNPSFHGRVLDTRGELQARAEPIGYKGNGEWFYTQEDWLEPGSYSMELVFLPEVCSFDEENDRLGIATQPGEVEFSDVYVQVYGYSK
jgi:hypothetical protein